MKSGIVYGGNSTSGFQDVLTWHDLDGKRIWLHTRQGAGSSRWLISLSIEIHGSSLPLVSEDEKKIRLKLAKSQQCTEQTELTATSIREFAISELLNSHSDSLFKVMAKQEQNKNRKVELVTEIRTDFSKSSNSFRFDSISEISNLGANSSDAILIAKVYEQVSQSGHRSVAKKTAETLGVNVELIHVALRVARRNDWLTSNGAGKSGGQLTVAGEKKFRQSKGPERLRALLNSEWRFFN